MSYKEYIGRSSPNRLNPSSLHPTPSICRPGENEFTMHSTPEEIIEGFHKNPPQRPVPYLPQPEDYLPLSVKEMKSGPYDAWATGRPNFSHVADLTGIRPVVDRFSITRYSECEWRKHNKDLLLNSHDNQNYSAKAEWMALNTIDHVMEETDKNQAENTRKLNYRQREVLRYKEELKHAISKMMEEIEMLEVQRQRLKKAMMIVLMPSSIAGESLDRRCCRLDIELVRDGVEDELTKELSLTSEIRCLLEKTLREVDNQLLENRSAKQRLEFDYGDKTRNHRIVATNAHLNNRSNTILFHPGAVTFQSDQSPMDLWNRFVDNILEESERVRIKSEGLRRTLDAILMNSARDLRTQADSVELALSKRIATTEAMKQQIEIEMKKVMRRIVDAENMMPRLKDSIRRLDTPMKVAQTRLYNKMFRPRVELCRDPPQFGLIDEVKSINESTSQLEGQLKHIHESHDRLLQTRSRLERDYLLKQKTLEIDREILREVRSHYPSANALSGYID